MSLRWIVFGLIIRSAVEIELCRARDFEFSVIPLLAILIRSRESPILRKGRHVLEAGDPDVRK